MFKRILESALVAVVGAAAGGVVTALIGNMHVVEPIKQDLAEARETAHHLQATLDRFKYGETVESARANDFAFEVERVERDDLDAVRVTILVANLKGEPRNQFRVVKGHTVAQTETLNVATVSKIQVFNSDLSTASSVGAPIPQQAKHVPILLEFDGLDKGARYLSSLSLNVISGYSSSDKFTVVFHDLDIAG